MTPSLTTSAAGRTYDYNRVVGGREQMNGIVSMAFGAKDEIYITQKALFFFDVSKLKIGPEPNDEKMIISFREKDPDFFEGTWPACLTVGPDHDIYVTDELRHVIYVFDQDGVLKRKFGSLGTGAGEFDRPSGIISTNNDSIYVCDTMNHRIQHVTTMGKSINEFGSQGSAEGQFQSPWGLDIDSDGNVFIADHKNHRIQKFDAEGNFIFTFGTYGSGMGEFDHPTDVAVDPDGDIYVSDWANNRVQVFDSVGEYLLQIKGSAIELSKWQKRYVESNPDVVKARRRVESLEPEMKFALPTGVNYDKSRDRLFVVDSQRWRIQIFNKLKDYAEAQFNI